jgi:hypothetical protein
MATKVVQSIMIDKKYAPNVETAKAWVQSLKFSVRDVDETPKFWRFRQQDPIFFKKNTFRHWHLSSGVRALVAAPKSMRIFAGLPSRSL